MPAPSDTRPASSKPQRKRLRTAVLLVVVAMSGGAMWAGSRTLASGRELETTMAIVTPIVESTTAAILEELGGDRAAQLTYEPFDGTYMGGSSSPLHHEFHWNVAIERLAATGGDPPELLVYLQVRAGSRFPELKPTIEVVEVGEAPHNATAIARLEQALPVVGGGR